LLAAHPTTLRLATTNKSIVTEEQVCAKPCCWASALHEIGGITFPHRVILGATHSAPSQMSRTVLWVDDNPLNNEVPAQVLKALQAKVVQVKTTSQALTQLKVRRFDAIISDMGRWEGPQEGYVLLDEVRRMGLTTPYFIFSAGGGYPPHVNQALARGAQGSTDSMNELLEFLHRAMYPVKGA
jgi:CheY-like chemotaxis protein